MKDQKLWSLPVLAMLFTYTVFSQQTYVPPVPSDGNYILSRSYQTSASSLDDIQYARDVIETIQYFDGLGREQQTIGIGQTPSGADMVTPYEYDQYGRMVREWLPFPAADDGVRGNYQPGPLLDAQQFYGGKYSDDFQGMATGDVNSYSEKSLEPSPLNRVLKQAAPGKDWRINGDDDSDRTIGFVYGTNTHDIENVNDPNNDNVRLFTVGFDNGDEQDPFLSNDGYYPANQLTKVTTKDENHDSGNDHTTEEFTDKNGRVVLKRTYNNGERHDTYYVYDDFGNLTYVVPPLVDTAVTITQDVLNDLCYQYVYDHRNRLMEKKIPGKGWEYIIYNNLDQPIMTQDANQRGNDEWLFTKYDVYGRVAYTGKATVTGGRPNIQQTVTDLGDDIVLWTSRTTAAAQVSTTDTKTINYDDEGYPNAGDITELLTVNYYDDYNIATADLGGAPTTVALLGATNGETNDLRTKGLPTVSLVRVLTTNDWIRTVTLYDDKARPVHTQSNNAYLGTVDVVQSQLDFVGKPLKVKTTHTRGGGTIVTIDNFTYDHVGRLLRQTQCIGDQTLGDSCEGGTGSPVEANPIIVDGGNRTTGLVATNSITIRPTTTISGTATFRIDPSATGGDGVGGNEELIAFNDYDELGQLEVKKVGGSPNNDFANTQGLQTIDYGYNVRGWLKGINDVNNIGSDLFAFGIAYNEGSNALYNGNIASTEWRTGNSDNGLKRYDYQYDALNRIMEAVSDNNDRYGLGHIEYDKNGNLLKLQRQGHVVDLPNSSNSAHFDTMDDLVYEYDNGNKLLRVTDSNQSGFEQGFYDGNTSGDDYVYDANGNMVIDRNKGIIDNGNHGITYNHLNLPEQVKIDGGTISYIYDATGAKLQKTVGSSVTIYAGNYIYSEGPSGPNLEFFSTPEGYVSPNDTNGYDYVYQYKDHLGNVRLSYMDNNGSTVIVEEDNYYPFGLKHKGYNDGRDPLANDVAQKWKYNGKEIQEELGLGWYDYGLRNYQPDLGRWFNVDPMAEEYKSFSGYNYSLNNPINYNDHDGSIVRDPKGNIVFSATGSQAVDNRQISDVTYGAGGIRKVVEIRTTFDHGYIYADNGTKVNAYSMANSEQITTFYDNSGKVISSHKSSVDQSVYDCKANCHGRTFADNKLFIDNDDVQTILENDGYKTVEELGSEIAIFSSEEGGILHSAVRMFDGTFENNAGILKTESTETAQEASRGFGDQTTFYFKPNSDFNIDDKRIENLGMVQNGVRKITDKNQINELLSIINGN